MDPFCIDSTLLGTDKHLVCEEDGFLWRDRVPRGAWHLNGREKRNGDCCLDTLLRLCGITIDLCPPTQFVNMMATVSPDMSHVPWQRVMPVAAHRAFVKKIVDQVVVAMATAHTGFYRNTWVPGNKVLTSLQRAKVNVPRFNELIEQNVGNIRSVESFRPNSECYAKPVTYDRFGTLTGRLTVTSGPMILTLKREYRDMIAPSTPNGRIVSIDFAALEARVLLYEAGRRCDEQDLYGMLARELGYDRKSVKGAVISELYGSSKWALGNALGISGKELNEFVKKIKGHFNTQVLLRRIKQQFVETGFIYNRYGRRVLIDEPADNIFINYYAQSTGSDVALLGFSKIVEKLSTAAPGVRPLFLLHDALILDVPGEQVNDVVEIKTVTVPGYVQAWPLKVEVMPCTP